MNDDNCFDCKYHGMSIEQVQKLLGHETLETTQKYAIVDKDEIKNAHRKYLS